LKNIIPSRKYHKIYKDKRWNLPKKNKR
jgi:hypothetical protein